MTADSQSLPTRICLANIKKTDQTQYANGVNEKLNPMTT